MKNKQLTNKVDNDAKSMRLRHILFITGVVLIIGMLVIPSYTSIGSVGKYDTSVSTYSNHEQSSISLDSSSHEHSRERLYGDEFQTLAMTDDGEYFAVGTQFDSDHYVKEVQIYKWDPNTEEYVMYTQIDEFHFPGNVKDLEFSDLDNDGSHELIIASDHGKLYVYEQNSRIPTKYDRVWFKRNFDDISDIQVIDFDEDNVDELLVIGGEHGIEIFGINPSNFNSTTDEFWSSYGKRYASNDLHDHPISILAGDFNENNIIDIVVGFEDGKIVILEQGELVNIKKSHHHPKYECNTINTTIAKSDHSHNSNYDLCFNEIWSDEDTLWNPISQLEKIDFNSDGNEEIAVLSQGQDVLLLDYLGDEQSFTFDRLTLTPNLWEKTGAYPLDYFVDELISGENITFNGITPEPMDWLNPYNVISPRTSAIEGVSDRHYTELAANGSEVLVDFGNYEEIVSGGSNESDLIVHLGKPFNNNLSDIDILFGNDLLDMRMSYYFEKVYCQGNDHHDDDHQINYHYVKQNLINIWTSNNNLTIHIDIDPFMKKYQWDFVRYLQITSNTTANWQIESIETVRINQRLSSVRSIFVDYVPSIDSKFDQPALFASTTEGKLIGFKQDQKVESWESSLVGFANSYEDQLFTQNNFGSWDVIPSPKYKQVENWINPQLVLQNLQETIVPQQVTIGPDLAEFTQNRDDQAENNLYLVDDENTIKMILDPYNTNKVGIIDSISEFSELEKYYALSDQITISFIDIYSSKIPELLVYSFSGVLDLWKLDAKTEKYTMDTIIDFADIDVNGTLSEISLYIDAMVTGDFNGDTLQDILLVADSEFYYLERNNSISLTQFDLDFDRKMFEDVEKELSHLGLHESLRNVVNVQSFDYDNDGDSDLLANLKNQPGFTFFENQYSNEKSNWQEKRSYVHFRQPLSTFTNADFEFGVIWNGIKSDLNDHNTFFAISKNPRSIDREMHAFSWESTFDGQQAILTVNSGEVSVILLNFLDNKKFDNWGFQYFEQWNAKLKYFKHDHDEHHDDHENVDHETVDYEIHDSLEKFYNIYNRPHCSCGYQNSIFKPIVVQGGDSDGDGIIDGFEGFSRIYSNKTDISNPDTDGDGLSDLFEMQYGFDPRSGDSDNDLIPDVIEALAHYDHDDHSDCEHDYREHEEHEYRQINHHESDEETEADIQDNQVDNHDLENNYESSDSNMDNQQQGENIQYNEANDVTNEETLQEDIIEETNNTTAINTSIDNLSTQVDNFDTIEIQVVYTQVSSDITRVQEYNEYNVAFPNYEYHMSFIEMIFNLISETSILLNTDFC